MIIRNLRSGRRLAVLAVFAIVAVSALGFAASNTVTDSRAGDGAGTVDGYTVSNIHYTLDGTDPSVLDAVDFDLDNGADVNNVKVQFNSAGSWYGCTGGPTSFSCDVSGGSVTVLSVTGLRVVAAD
ncbi:MAG: hypothetical protein AMXMBFR80_10900 [Dehalococcoidia bacterium]